MASPAPCPPEEETMSSALASISSRREKASKALSALEGHRNLISSCIGKWQELERSFGVAERSLQQKFKELSEREKEFDAKMEDLRGGLEKREGSIQSREEASLARVKEQKDSAIAAILEERKKVEEQRLRKGDGVKEEVNYRDKIKDSNEKNASDENVSEKKVLDNDVTEKNVSEKKENEKEMETEKEKEKIKASGSFKNDKEMQQKAAQKKPFGNLAVQQKDENQNKRTQSEKETGIYEKDMNKKKRKDSQHGEDAAIAKRIKEVSIPKRNNRSSDGAISLEEAISQAKGASEGQVLSQMKFLIEKSDGKGLRELISQHIKEIPERGTELRSALQACNDPCRIILKAFDVYEDVKRATFINKNCQACILLLENLSEVIADPILGSGYPVVPVDVREDAKVVARHLKLRLEIQRRDDYNLEVHLFLQFLATFGLGTEYSDNELLNYVVSISRRGMAPSLCRALGLTERIPALVDKLIKEGKQLEAISFASSFGIMDKIDPGYLLRAYLEDSERAAQLLVEKARSKASGLNDAHVKQVSALKSAVKTIEEYNLASFMSPESLKKRIAVLDEEKSERKRASTVLKQERKITKSVQETSNVVDVGLGSDPNTGIGSKSSNASNAGERGQYVLTDLGRPMGRSNYVGTDLGPSYHSSYGLASQYDYERRPESMHTSGYGYNGRIPVSQSNSYVREAVGPAFSGSDLRISSASSYSGILGSNGNYPHGSISNYPCGSVPSSNYPHDNNVPSSNYQRKSNVPPSNYPHTSNVPPSNYLPYYRR